MTHSSRPPRLAVIVGNAITGDSRVQKSALAAARAGWDVTLVGVSAGQRTVESAMGPIRVIRVAVGSGVRDRTRTHGVRRLITQFGIANPGALARKEAAHQAWTGRMTARVTRLKRTRLGYPVRGALSAALTLRRSVHRFRVRAFNWEQRRPRKPTGDWRRDWPYLVDLELALGPVIDDLKPDVIHANDITMIGVAAQSVARMRATGHRVAWLYDAHEYIAGVEWKRPEHASAFPALEREFIGRADAVVTVSPELAEVLRRDHQLARLPVVVRNAPIRAVIGEATRPQSVRDLCGLADDAPLMVYAGWIGPERGLGTAVEALAKLPTSHLAIVVGRTSPELTLLLNKAKDLGVDGRVHVLPYVPQHAVPDYLSTADLGLICFKRTPNCEISLPTKFPEYIQAGLPVVVSDVKALSAFVEQHGVGEVFRAGDTDSFVAAVGLAMANRQTLVARITETLLEELSWEHQSLALLDLYRQISAFAPTDHADVAWSVVETPVLEPPAADHPLPRWRPLGDSPIRLGLGPANFAGQAAAFAQAICQHNPEISAEVMMRRVPTSGDFPADVYLDSARLGELDTQIQQLRRVIGRYTHLIADAFLPVFGYLNGDNIEDDLPALRRANVKVALLGHGSEVRHPGRHLERHEFSLFRDAPEGMAARLTERAERNRRVAMAAGLPVFVTTPDLLDDLPMATWAPLVVDVHGWSCDHAAMERRRPIVLHGPSQRWTKGTDRILPLLTSLHDRGAIELRLAEKVSRAEMRELVTMCDFAIDQFTTGSYGAFAVEAMAAGRPVIAYLSDSVERAIGVRPPIVNATPLTLGDVIQSLLDDRTAAAAIGAQSARYAREFHDGRRTARAFADFLT